ncbi:MAG: TetR/AcrR family transcriptional regulator [Saprospiraceae bacterium]|nr:TetR/AcrR family transcriptional regulator [Saprospiraceae bacterium]
MKKTKQRITDKAKELFNQQGFSQVTIRMIASSLGMSSGNLNYHFKKREDILEFLYFEMVSAFDQRVKTLKTNQLSLVFMQQEVLRSMRRMLEYSFFWTDLYNLLKSNQKIRAHFERVRKDRINGYLYLFNFFIEISILNKPSYSEEYRFLAERMINYSNTWIYSSQLYTNERSNQQLIQKASFHLLSMLYPYLSSTGKEEFDKLHQSFLS